MKPFFIRLPSFLPLGLGLLATMLILGIAVPVRGADNDKQNDKRYIGSQACRDCHEQEYDSYDRYAKKRHSWEHISAMRKGLTEPEFKTCFGCHTTGYGKPSGFVSAERTPNLKNVGCEACHGPGSVHAESEDPADIKGSLTIKDCTGCHNEERVAAFNFTPLIHGGAH
jgi:hypothetical protein